MWYREYRDYKPDEPLRKQRVKSGRGIVGCEMHEIFGWGNQLHHPRAKKKGVIARLFTKFFGKQSEKDTR